MSDMRVIEFGDGGTPDVLHVAARPTPTPAPGEILIKVTAAGVNGPDLKQRKGNYPPPPGALDLIGLEVSGHVAAIGAGVTGWDEGAPVIALTNGGGYAEYVPVPAGQCLAPPPGVDLVDAAGICETFFTVWSNVWYGTKYPTPRLSWSTAAVAASARPRFSLPTHKATGFLQQRARQPRSRWHRTWALTG